MRNHIFTSESVSEGHPDKVADQISDAVLDACLEQDPESRVACETMVTTDLVVLAGEVSTEATVDFEQVVRDQIADIGYTVPDMGFCAENVEVIVRLDAQSPDIALGVDEGSGRFEEQGAGDQGMMFGYACNETQEMMPASIYYSHRILESMARARRIFHTPFLPDSKSQVTVAYSNGQLARIPTVVVSTQHRARATQEYIEEAVREYGLSVLPEELTGRNFQLTKVLVNPTGRFVHGGPAADCGLTGRKIIVDTYGGHGRHGGGAFSGKDPSKVDRSAAYFCRYVAKNIVAAQLAERCEVQVAYAIGVAAPVSIYVNTFGTTAEDIDEQTLESAVKEVFDFRPALMIEYLNLKRPIYTATAKYGHFGRTGALGEFPWENTDRVHDLLGFF
jgi:S-adenosylmethionine synthetase